MTTEEFLRYACPNHKDSSSWNKSELLQILELHTKQLRKHAVSGMFSSEKLEQAYKDGVRDVLAKGYGTFDEENYR